MSDLRKAIEELADEWLLSSSAAECIDPELSAILKGAAGEVRQILDANPEPEPEESMVAKALMDAANDPALRLSGHSGISITKLRARAIREQMIDDE